MENAYLNEGTKIPQAFKKPRPTSKPKAAKGRMLYMKQIKASKKAK